MSALTISILTAVISEEKALRRVLAHVPDVAVTRIGLRGHRLTDVTLRPRQTVILAGVGGGCHPGLNSGDVVIDPWPGGFSSPRARAGIITCSPTILQTPEQKHAFHTDHGADVVEMEGDAVRCAVQRTGGRLIHVRVILDAVNDTLPPDIGRWVDQDGHARPGAIAGAMLRHPGTVAELIGLGRRTSAALARLGLVVRDLVEHQQRQGS